MLQLKVEGIRDFCRILKERYGKSMYLLYFVLWIIFNANFTLEICLFGLVIAAAIFAFTCKFADHSIKKELALYRKSIRFLAYICLLVKEIIKANIGVIKLILTQEEEVVPCLVTFKSFLKTPAGKAFLANAITLTPGTITVSMEDDLITVHCLDEAMVDGIQGSDFEEMLEELEK